MEIKENMQKEIFYIPKRFIVACLAFFGLFNAYCMRVNVSVAIIAMVNHTGNAHSNISNHFTECPALADKNETVQEHLKGERYNWDAYQQGLILSAFFYGYFVAMLLSGYLAEKVGAVRLFGASILSTAFLTLLTPLIVEWGLISFLVLRVLEGLGEGPVYPCVMTIISSWSPKMERSRMAAIIFTGGPLGNVFSFIVSGYLSSSEYFGGWPSVFYAFGVLGCLWFILWIVFIYETPESHPTIRKEELEHFKDNSVTSSRNRKVPWRDIATSVPVFATIISTFGHMFGFNIMMTEVPTYLNSILHFNTKSNGFLSALPFVVQAISASLVSFVADNLRKSKRMSITTIRKLFNSIGMFGPALCLVGVTLAGCDSTLIIVLLSLAMAINGCIFSGSNITYIDMCPDFAGSLFAISNGIANLSGVLGPLIVSLFTASGATLSNWGNVFYTTAAIYFISGLIFVLFGSAELQPWGAVKKESPRIDIPENKKPSNDVKCFNTRLQ